MVKSTKRDQLVGAFVRGQGLVLTVAIAGSTVRFEAAAWPGSPAWRGQDIIGAFVFSKASHAELAIAQCGSSRDIVTATTDWDMAVRTVGTTWRTVDDVFAEARTAIDDLEVQMKAWNAGGGLQKINGSYKRYRAACLTVSKPAASYSSFLHGYKVNVADLMGKNRALGVPMYLGILDVKPPALSLNDDWIDSRQQDEFPPWPGRHGLGPLPGWSPSLTAHPREFRSA